MGPGERDRPSIRIDDHVGLVRRPALQIDVPDAAHVALLTALADSLVVVRPRLPGDDCHDPPCDYGKSSTSRDRHRFLLCDPESGETPSQPTSRQTVCLSRVPFRFPAAQLPHAVTWSSNVVPVSARSSRSTIGSGCSHRTIESRRSASRKPGAVAPALVVRGNPVLSGAAALSAIATLPE